MSDAEIRPVRLGIITDPPTLVLAYDEITGVRRKRRKRKMPLRNFNDKSNVSRVDFMMRQRHEKYLLKVLPITVFKMLRIIQEIMKGNCKEDAVSKVNKEYEINPDENLNKLSTSELAEKKLIMDEAFRKNLVEPGHPDFVYDKIEEFDKSAAKPSDWDEDSQVDDDKSIPKDLNVFEVSNAPDSIKRDGNPENDNENNKTYDHQQSIAPDSTREDDKSENFPKIPIDKDKEDADDNQQIPIAPDSDSTGDLVNAKENIPKIPVDKGEEDADDNQQIPIAPDSDSTGDLVNAKENIPKIPVYKGEEDADETDDNLIKVCEITIAPDSTPGDEENSENHEENNESESDPLEAVVINPDPEVSDKQSQSDVEEKYADDFQEISDLDESESNHFDQEPQHSKISKRDDDVVISIEDRDEDEVEIEIKEDPCYKRFEYLLEDDEEIDKDADAKNNGESENDEKPLTFFNICEPVPDENDTKMSENKNSDDDQNDGMITSDDKDVIIKVETENVEDKPKPSVLKGTETPKKSEVIKDDSSIEYIEEDPDDLIISDEEIQDFKFDVELALAQMKKACEEEIDSDEEDEKVLNKGQSVDHELDDTLFNMDLSNLLVFDNVSKTPPKKNIDDKVENPLPSLYKDSNNSAEEPGKEDIPKISINLAGEGDEKSPELAEQKKSLDNVVENQKTDKDRGDSTDANVGVKESEDTEMWDLKPRIVGEERKKTSTSEMGTSGNTSEEGILQCQIETGDGLISDDDDDFWGL